MADDFLRLFHGDHQGVLKWEHLDALWEKLRAEADGQWYIITHGDPLPEEPASAQTIDQFLRFLDDTIRKHQDPVYCGFVFVDNRENPNLIKIFNPKLLGCGGGPASHGPSMPHWMLSRVAPVPYEPAPPPAPEGIAPIERLKNFFRG